MFSKQLKQQRHTDFFWSEYKPFPFIYYYVTHVAVFFINEREMLYGIY